MPRRRQQLLAAILLSGLPLLLLNAPAAAQTYTPLYSFDSAPYGAADGGGPIGNLIYANNTLYGTTQYGGKNNGGNLSYGTVFAFNPASTTYQQIYAFNGQHNDGYGPVGNVIYVGSKLYGTTQGGGGGNSLCSAGCGTVFALHPVSGQINWTEKFLYPFGTNGADDGFAPLSGLVDLDGTLYGTTQYGGGFGGGTIFSVSTKGAESVAYAFGSNGSPGGRPYAGMIKVNGILYGTTSEGAGGNSNYCSSGSGCGVLFSWRPNGAGGTETVLHIFGNVGDGSHPEASVINVGGTLYGTTSGGGNTGCGGGGCGTVFSWNIATQTYTNIYAFNGMRDGANPMASLLYYKGLLYGTNATQGTGCSTGCSGTVFSMPKTGPKNGTLNLLHTFNVGDASNYLDGSMPESGLTLVNSVLYGTTIGGSNNAPFNAGIIYAITP